MRKKLLVWLLCAALLAALLPMPAALAADPVCEIVGGAQYETLDEAVAAVPADTPTTLRLLQTIDRTSTLILDGSKKITLDLNGFNLNITTASGAGLEVRQSASLTTSGAGTLNISGFIYGIYAEQGATVSITGNVSATGGHSESAGDAIGIYAFESAGIPVAVTVNGDVSGYVGVIVASGAEVTVTGSVTGVGAGLRVLNGGVVSITGSVSASTVSADSCVMMFSGTVHIGGSVTATGTDSDGIYAANNATLTVGGNVSAVRHGISAYSSDVTITGGVTTSSSDSSYTAYAGTSSVLTISGGVTGAGDCGVVAETSGKVTVTGNIQSYYTGIRAATGGEVFALGDVTADGTVGVGVNAYETGEATVDGTIHAHKAMIFGESDGAEVTPTTKPGYRTYSDGAGSTIWVKAPIVATTFVLSNEEGRLIDKLIADGYGNSNLYQVLVSIAPASNGIISDAYLDTLALCDSGSEIFTYKLNDFAGLNGGVAINTDGTIFTTSIRGRTYYRQMGYSTYPTAATQEIFTYADSPAYYIDAESGGTTYKAFAIGWSSNQIPTFMLSNEEGGLIDRLIAAGHGDDSLYEVLQLLQPVSGGAIPADFMAVLAAGPADCDAKTAPLSDFADESNNPIGIGSNGNLIVAPIYGNVLDGDDDFSTTSGNIMPVGDVHFTAADSEGDAIDAGAMTVSGITYYYKAFGVAWAAEAPQPTTFVLSNEEGGLIDYLIAGGYGNLNLYHVLVSIAPASNGIISDAYLDTLALCDSGCEIFTYKLNDFAGLNNPVCVNTDGTLGIQPIFGRDYYGQSGYSSYPATLVPDGENFIKADSPAYYIDAGEREGGSRYYAFAIAWMPSAITVAGTATDDTSILQIDNKTPSARDKTWEITVTTGTVKAGVSASDVTINGLPAGLSCTAARGTGNTIIITLTGAATTALTADATVTAVIKGSAVTEANAQDSAGIALVLWYVGPGTTFVLTNEGEGYLIDSLIAAGHGDDSLYEVLEFLQPQSGGVISERFMKTLASNPIDEGIYSEVFTVTLNTGHFNVNYPVCVNADGTVTIQPIYGRDYDGHTGYTTTVSILDGVGSVWVTAAISPVYFIDAGAFVEGEVEGRYYAFAIAWMSAEPPPATLPTVVTNAVNTSGVTQASAAVSGSVTSDGGAAVTGRGFAWGTSANPTVAGGSIQAGSGTGDFSAALTGLAPSTVYHVRAYAVNSVGTSYGEDRTFTTKASGGGGGLPMEPGLKALVTGASGPVGTLPVTVSGSTASANMTGAEADGFFAQGSFQVTMPTVAGVSAYTLILPAASLTGRGSDLLTLSTVFGSATFPGSMLAGAGGNTASLTVARSDTSQLTDAEKAAVGGRPVLRLVLTLDGVMTGWRSSGTPVTVSLPYTPTAEELLSPDGIIVCELGGGAPVCVPNGRWEPATGTVVFTADHLSEFAVSYRRVSYSDVSGWYGEAVAFVSARGIMSGTGGGKFEPLLTMTRAMAVSVLYRLSGDTGSYLNVFSDVPEDAWYRDAAAWAAANGIVRGAGDGSFAPDAEVSREQLAVMLFNYAKTMGYDVSVGESTNILSYTDAFTVSDYAYPALQWACGAGILCGDERGFLSPGNAVTRAEAAVIFKRFIVTVPG